MFSTYIEEKSTVKPIYNHLLREIQKKVFLKTWAKSLKNKKYLYNISFLGTAWFRKWFFRFIPLLGYCHIHLFFPPIQFSFLGCDYCIWNRLEVLEMSLLPKAKYSRNTNRLGLFNYSNLRSAKSQKLPIWPLISLSLKYVVVVNRAHKFISSMIL